MHQKVAFETDGSGSARAETSGGDRAAVRTTWGSFAGVMAIAAGVLTVLANVLHPRRTFDGFAHTVVQPFWESIHALGILAFLTALMTLIGILAHHVRSFRGPTIVGFLLATTGIVLSVGVLVVDSFIFPLLGRHEPSAVLLEVPGPIIPYSSFGALMVTAAVTYVVGYALLAVAGWRGRLVSRTAWAMIGTGVLPLAVGALAAPGIDIAGAWLFGIGHIVLGRALVSRILERPAPRLSDQPTRKPRAATRRQKSSGEWMS